MRSIDSQAVGEVISGEFGVHGDRLKPQTELESDLGADSLDKLKLLMALEERFQLGISSDVLPELRTVADLTELVQRQAAGTRRAADRRPEGSSVGRKDAGG